MATPAEWADAYLAQARADLEAARDCGVPSVRAMLMQMTLEKFAKAALLRSGMWSIQAARATHVAAVPMMRQLLHRRTCKKLGWNHADVRKRLLPIVDELERAHPQSDPALPCLEYPWLGSDDQVRWPEEHLAIVRRFRARSGDAARLLQFLGALDSKFDLLVAR